MSHSREAKREASIDASLQLLTSNAIEDSASTAVDNAIEIALEKRKDTDKPLYIKRI